MKIIAIISSLVFMTTTQVFTQTDSSGNAVTDKEELHVWKVIDAADGRKFWYDASALDTMKGDKFNIWILETHRPPKKYEGIEGEVYRSKTQYCINLTTVKYGILKVRYYDVNNKEIYRFDYDVPPPPEIIRYTYPVTENSLLHFLLKELYRKDSVKSDKQY